MSAELHGWASQNNSPLLLRTINQSWFKTSTGKTLLKVIGVIGLAAIAVGAAALGGAPLLLAAVGAKQMIAAGSALLFGVIYVACTRFNPFGWFKYSKGMLKAIDWTVGVLIALVLIGALLPTLVAISHGGIIGGMR